jgi:hypothetical protein
MLMTTGTAWSTVPGGYTYTITAPDYVIKQRLHNINEWSYD